MTITIWLIAIIILSIIIADVILYVVLGNSFTFSRTILDITRSSNWGLLIPFAFGVLISHFFFPIIMQHVGCP